jgi:hypothetical protein
MSKYASLGDFLKQQPFERVPMTFQQIEKVIGAKLPLSAKKHRPWWSNNPNNSVMTKVWLDAGFESEQVDMAARKLVFRRVRSASRVLATAPVRGGMPGHHPALGALKGLLRIASGTDLTQPADPTWGRVYDQKRS